jgi:hypothetical protein
MTIPSQLNQPPLAPGYSTPTQTPDQYSLLRIIEQAYQDVGLIQDNELPNGDQTRRAFLYLQDIMNLWITQGVKLWLNTDLPIPLAQGKTSYTLGPGGDVNMVRPLQVNEGYYQDQYGIRRPLIPISWNDWVRLSQITIPGPINQFFVDKQQYQFVIWLWQTPDAYAATGTVHLIVRNQINNPTNLTKDAGFPIEWYMALRWALAAELAIGQPQRIVALCDQRAATYKDALEGWDVEDANLRFTIDPRMSYTQHDFT